MISHPDKSILREDFLSLTCGVREAKGVWAWSSWSHCFQSGNIEKWVLPNAPFAFPSLYRSGSPASLPTVKLGASTPINVIRINSHRCSQRSTSQIILESVNLTISINSHIGKIQVLQSHCHGASFLCCCYNKIPGRNKTEGRISSLWHMSWIETTMMEASWWDHFDTTGKFAATGKDQRKMDAGTQLMSSFTCSSGSQLMRWWPPVIRIFPPQLF